MWRYGHYQYDYAQYFDKLWKEDLHSMVARDRNHPSVIMWSIGNEIKNKETAEIVDICRELTGFVKTLDTTRPVTAGVNSIVDATDDFLAPLDVCGYNYCLNHNGCNSHKRSYAPMRQFPRSWSRCRQCR